MKKKQEIESLYKKIAPLQNRARELEEEEVLKVQLPRIKKMVGFSLRSTYEPKTYYAKILDLVDSKWGHQFILEVCSINKEGNPYLHLDNISPYTNKEWWDAEVPLAGYEKCPDEEYQTFKAKVMGELGSQKSLRAWIKKLK